MLASYSSGRANLEWVKNLKIIARTKTPRKPNFKWVNDLKRKNTNVHLIYEKVTNVISHQENAD